MAGQHDDAVLDLEIVSAGMRLAYDDRAMDDLFRAWDKRVAALGRSPNEKNHRRLFDHLRSLGPLFDTMDDERFINNIERAVTTVPAPSFVFTPNGVVVELNELAAKRYGLRQGVACGFGFIEPISVTELSALRRSAASSGNRRRAILHVLEENNGPSFAEVFILPPGGNGENLLVFRNLEIEWRDAIGNQLTEAFSLTAAEVDVCRLLYSLQKVGLVANARARSPRTVGVQLSSIFEKTRTENQLGLYRLLTLLCAREALSCRDAFQPWADPYGREQIIKSRDGRNVAYSWIGAEDGLPVLFLHGLSVGYAMDRAAESLLAEAGLKLIAVNRPGHGHSDAYPKLNAVAAAEEAVRTVLDSLRLRGCLGVAMNSAAAPLLSLSLKDKDAFSGILAIGGYLPMSRQKYLRTQPALHRAGFSLYRTTPWLIHILGRRFLGTIKRRGYTQYLDMAYAESPVDLETIRQPNIKPLIINACSMMTAQGMHSFVSDLDLYLYDWIEHADDLAIPFCILHGERDPTARLNDLSEVANGFEK
ncbi:MAG: alpha/beta hydrolase, partial [Parvularcula sp.]|nr:alpha/beta hydrolase [Parvularcula sp.]